MTLEDAEAYKASRSFSNEPNSALPENAHAFEDLTDFEVSGPFWGVASSDPSARTEYELHLRAVNFIRMGILVGWSIFSSLLF